MAERRHVGYVECGKTHRHEHHLPHTFTFQATDDSSEQVDGDCPGWAVDGGVNHGR